MKEFAYNCSVGHFEKSTHKGSIIAESLWAAIHKLSAFAENIEITNVKESIPLKVKNVSANRNCTECGAILNYQIFKSQVVAEVCPECDFVLQLFTSTED